jgi:hypothetical protein
MAGVDSLLGKDAPAAILGVIGVIRAMLVRSHEQTAAASFDVRRLGAELEQRSAG